MEEWCTKIEELLQSSLQVEEELKVLKTSTVAELENKMTKIDQDLAESGSLLKEVQEESDSVVARNMKVCEEVQTLENRQKSELHKVREALEEGRRDIERAETSLQTLRNIFAVRNNPERTFNYAPVNFTLTNFHERKDNSEIWCSPSFYSFFCGYKMQLQVYPNGDGAGRGTHVSIKVALMPGEFDDLLCWPFRGIITIHLLNQRKDIHHVVDQVWLTTLDNLYMREKPVVVDGWEEDAMRIGEGKDKFIAHADLRENPGFFSDKEYLKNNSLSFCVWNVDVFYQHH